MAIGLTWLAPALRSPTGRERRKTRELLSLDMNVVGYTEMETPAGSQLGATPDKEDLGLNSGAAHLAQAQRSVVLIERLAANLYWLCTIEDGAVFPAGDLIGQKFFIEERLKEIRSDIAGKNIPLYDKFGEFEIEGALNLDFAELVDGVAPASDITCRPIQTRKLNKPVLGVAVGALLACSAVGAWQYIDHADEADRQRLLRQQAFQKTFDQERVALSQQLSQHAALLLATLSDTVYDRPLRAGGWRTHSYEWQDDVISVTWLREHGDVNDISAYLESRQFEFSHDAKIVTEIIPFAATLRSEDDEFEKRLDQKSERMQLLDQLAKLPGHWTLDPARPFGERYPVTRSRLIGGSSQLNEMIAAAISLKELPLHVSRVKVTLADSFSWELEGDYFAYAD